MPLPQMTEEQRKAALAKAAETRKKRAEVRAKIKAGKVSAKEAMGRRSDPVIGKMRVKQFITTFPGFGKAKAEKIMAEIGIPDTRKLAGLGEKQAAALVEALS